MPVSADPAALQRLQQQLDHVFRTETLLTQALTHSAEQGTNNQRLEFLGDAVLGTAISALLMQAHPAWDEGALSVARTALVRKEALADIAQVLCLGDLLLVSRAVARSGAVHAQPAVLADAVEALIGAVFLDGGYPAAERVVGHLFAGRLAATDGAAPPLHDKDAKTRLQELMQARGWPLPAYQLQDPATPVHAATFVVEAHLPRNGLRATGTGTSRKRAEQDAARQLLQQLEQASRP